MMAAIRTEPVENRMNPQMITINGEPHVTTSSQLNNLKVKGPIDAWGGICSNLLDTADWWEHCDKCFTDWDEFSGDREYPVPGYGTHNAMSAYNLTDDTNMWNPDHEYGAARLRLLDHCIKWFTEFESA